jgi:hypothetical protein
MTNVHEPRIVWRGSVSDLVTDLCGCMSREQLAQLRDEIAEERLRPRVGRLVLEQSEGVLIDVSPSWWTRVHRSGAASAPALAIRFVFEAAKDEELEILELHAGRHALTILVRPTKDNVPLGAAALVHSARAVVQRIEDNITIEDDDRVPLSAPEVSVSRRELEVRLLDCGFSLSVGFDRRPRFFGPNDDVWVFPSRSVFVMLTYGGEDDNRACYGSAMDVEPGGHMTYAAVMKKLSGWQSGDAVDRGAANVPGNVLDRRDGDEWSAWSTNLTIRTREELKK